MKCVYCGEELKDGSVYCSKCGREVQVVPDYNILEDDYLKQVLAEENHGTQQAAAASSAADSREEKALNKNKKKIYIIAGVGVALVIALVVFFVVWSGVKSRQANSFDYQVQMAEEAYNKGDIDAAIEYYGAALLLDKDNIEVRLALANIYVDRKDYDSALILCQEVIQLDDANQEACELLIDIYENQKNYDAILALYEAVDESLQDLFAAYVVTAPEFSIEEGEYDEVLSLELTTSGDYTIYYSTDGSDPTLRGERYTEPIEMDENLKTYTISAVCMNDKGIYGDIVTKAYTIDLPAPDMPIVTPDGGDFGVETTVTVTVPDGCSAYYTWDGTDPTVYSTKYTGPITIPEGNNVLAVMIVDNTTNLSSDIYRGNFIYYDENVEGEDISGDVNSMEDYEDEDAQ